MGKCWLMQEFMGECSHTLCFGIHLELSYTKEHDLCLFIVTTGMQAACWEVGEQGTEFSQPAFMQQSIV